MVGPGEGAGVGAVVGSDVVGARVGAGVGSEVVGARVRAGVVVLLSPVSMVGATGAGAVGAPVTTQVGSISNGGTQSPCSHSTRLKLTVSATGSVDRSCSTIDSATRSTVSSVQS